MTGTVDRLNQTLTLPEATRGHTPLRANLNIKKSNNGSLELDNLVHSND